MKQQKFYLVGEPQREAAIAAVSAAKVGQIVTISDRNRSAEQNALFHMWCSEIAKQMGDRSMLDVKWECNMPYTHPLRMQDEMFAWLWGNIAPKLNRVQLRKWCESKNGPKLSSGLDVEQMRQMMDTMSADYLQDGYELTDPEMMKYEAHGV